MKHLIQFTIGSMYGSGHGKKDTFIIESNIAGEELTLLHKEVRNEFGFEIGQIASDYDSSSISPDILSKLYSVNLIGTDLIEEINDYVEECNIESFDFSEEKIKELYSKMSYLYFETIDQFYVLNLWLDILKYINPFFEPKILNNFLYNLNSNITPPGYGLYH